MEKYLKFSKIRPKLRLLKNLDQSIILNGRVLFTEEGYMSAQCQNLPHWYHTGTTDKKHELYVL